MLKDARTRLTISDEPIDLVGIRFWTQAARRHRARSRAAPHGTTILLAHDPRRLTEAAALEDSARALRAHARRTGRAAGGRRDRRAEIPGRSPASAAATTRRSSSAAASARSTCRSGSTVRRKSRCSRCDRRLTTSEAHAERRRRPDAAPAILRLEAAEHGVPREQPAAIDGVKPACAARRDDETTRTDDRLDPENGSGSSASPRTDASSSGAPIAAACALRRRPIARRPAARPQGAPVRSRSATSSAPRGDRRSAAAL